MAFNIANGKITSENPNGTGIVIVNGRISMWSAEAPPPPPVGWTGKFMGVTNPAKILGVDVANIAKVNGV